MGICEEFETLDLSTAKHTQSTNCATAVKTICAFLLVALIAIAATN